MRGHHRRAHHPVPFPGKPRLERARRQGGRHRARVGHGRRPEGGQRPPGHGDEPGAGGVPPLPEGDAAQPRRSALAGARPLRALCGSLQPHPLHPALPRRLGPRARGPEVAAHLGQQDPRPPGVRPHRRGRDDHRPPGPGHRQRGRDGDGCPSRARPAGPQRRPGRVALRPQHLRDRQRRRHRGRGQLGGLLHRRHAAARQPDPDLRREQDLHRGRHRHRPVRGRGQALRGLRLARAGRRLDEGRLLQGGRARALQGDPGGGAGDGPAQPDRAAHDHRVAGA